MSVAMKLNQVFTSVSASTTTNSTIESKKSSTTTANGLSSSTSTHKSGKFFEDVQTKLSQEGASFVSKVNADIGFEVSTPNGRTVSYVVDLKVAPGSVYINDGSIKPACSISISDEDLVNIVDGKLNMMSVCFIGKKKYLNNLISLILFFLQILKGIYAKEAKSYG